MKLPQRENVVVNFPTKWTIFSLYFVIFVRLEAEAVVRKRICPVFVFESICR